MFKQDGQFKPQTKTVNLILLDGGVGDHVASLVAVNYVHTRYPWVTFLIWTPDFLVELAKHLIPGARIGGFTEMKTKYEPKKPTKTTKWDGIISPMKIHLLDYAFLKLSDENPALEHKNYLQIRPNEIDVSSFNLPEKYIVLTTGYTVSVREFPAASINSISMWAKSQGLGVVFLGQKQTKTGAFHNIAGAFNQEIDFKAGIDLIDKTSLLQASRIMSGAKAVVGVDNGLLHIAGCTQVSIVGGFTTVSPEIRMPVRHNILGWNYYPVTPSLSLGCRFCQQNTNFLYGHDYKNCLEPQEITIPCVSQMTASKFIKEIEKCL